MSSSPEKKKKKLAEELPSTRQTNPTPSLPDELLTSCIARLSRLYYPTLSLVSKSFRSLLSSPELYKARSLSSRTETCLYLCLESSSDSRWFTLCRKPDKTVTKDDVSKNKKNNDDVSKKKSTSYVLSKLPALHSPPAVFSGLVSVGSDIYNIRSSSNVSVLDCRFHTWRKAPSLPVELMALSACAVDEKIYVAGIHGESLKNASKVLDARTQTWDHVVSIPCSLTRRGALNMRSVCIDGKSHVATDDGVVCYNSQEGKWELGEAKMGSFRFSDSYCEVENVLYSVCNGTLRWYDGEVNVWRSLDGLVGLPKFLPGVSVRLCDYGGNMVVVWDKNMLSSGQKKILCAEIALERRGVCEIWGGVEWIDHVLTVPIGYYIVKALSATV
ncbi:hypothetical protein DY000_02041773 [Brassica cretica]|uniref:F-box domain-containing protein n=2 Tax=Brassica cretica TaxID=69181 RepID=A0ABQ7BKE0_BRACR|nr:hypothetical protein DY000_02041773 [Brassica cretica]